MALYEVRWRRTAIKELRRLPAEMIRQIHEAAGDLALDPFPLNSKKLTGSDRGYRIRIGDYRVVYEVLSEIVTIEIVRIGHRQGIYKK